MGLFNGSVKNIISHVTNRHVASVAYCKESPEKKNEFPLDSNDCIEPHALFHFTS